MIALALAAANALPVQAAQVSGTLRDAFTKAAVEFDYDSSVGLNRCDGGGSCENIIGWSGINSKGHFSFTVPDNTAGTFRLRALVPLDENRNMFVRYYQAESQPFVIQQGEGNTLHDLSITPRRPAFDDVVPCAIAQPGSDCVFSYTVRNPTSMPVSLSVWAEVAQLLPTPRHYTIGLSDKSRAPITVELPANGTRRLTQRFSVPADMPLGSTGTVSLQASDGSNQSTAASALLPKFKFVAGSATHRANSPAPQPNSSAGQPKPISGRIVDAVTGAPITGSDFDFNCVNLMRCDDASFAVCSHLISSMSSPWVGADGSCSIQDANMSTGRYQIQVHTANRTAYSAVVNYTGKAVTGVTVPVTHWLANLNNITTCPDTLKAGSTCTVSADVENATGQPATFDIVANVASSQTRSPYPKSSFDVGLGSDSSPVWVTLAAGAKQRISITLNAIRNLPIDGTAAISLSASVHDQALSAASPHVDAGNLRIVP